MKKNVLSVALAILMVMSMMLFAAGCGSNSEAADASAARIAELEQENAALQSQLEKLTAEMDRMSQKVVLQDWTMEAQAWSDSNGATVTFTASPLSYVDGTRAALSVRMGDLEAESTNCVWNGTAFTGSVELSAADGYSYHCILTNPDGSQTETELNSPANVTDELLVYLGSSLSTYANLIVETWDATANELNIQTGFAQVQMPRLTFSNVTPDISSAALFLTLNGEEVSRQLVTLAAGEGEGSFEASIANSTFAMPDMEEDCQLDLWLEVQLNTGSTVTVSGGSWYNSDGQLQLVVG